MPEPNATPAPLTMTPETEADDRRRLTVFPEAYPLMARDIATRALAELDATRAKLAEAEAKYNALPKVECACHPGVRWPSAHWGQTCALTAAESRVAALTEACTLGNRRLGYWCDLHGSLPEDRAALSAMQAALSPSQDAKEARDA